MREKLVAGLIAAAVLTPACAVCVLGPAFLGSAIAWVTGWLGGFDLLATTGLAILAGGALYAVLRRRRAKADAADEVAIPASRAAERGIR